MRRAGPQVGRCERGGGGTGTVQPGGIPSTLAESRVFNTPSRARSSSRWYSFSKFRTLGGLTMQGIMFTMAFARSSLASLKSVKISSTAPSFQFPTNHRSSSLGVERDGGGEPRRIADPAQLPPCQGRAAQSPPDQKGSLCSVTSQQQRNVNEAVER